MFFFFFQAEDGIRDTSVTGVQTCALPISPLGRSLRQYLDLDEAVLDLNVTPNRGDVLSILGVAREVAALAGTKVTGPGIARTPAGHAERFPVKLEAPAACPRFAGCILRGVDNRAAVPLWMRERLRRAGVRSISPVVDVTNYEIGRAHV